MCELPKILDSIDTQGRHALHVFNDIDPSKVRKQSGYCEKAFVKHEERFCEDKEKIEKIQRCREALTRVANISGWDIGNK